MNRVALLTLLFAFTVGVVFASEDVDVEPPSMQEQLMDLGFRVFKEPVEAPDFELQDLSGATKSLDSYSGKFVFLNFWATWCPPCRAEMPSMQALYEMLGDEAFEIVAVDLRESKKTVTGFIDKFGFTFPVLLDTTGVTAARYEVRSIPSTFLINGDGNVIGFLVGSRSWEGEEIETLFRDLIGAD